MGRHSHVTAWAPRSTDGIRTRTHAPYRGCLYLWATVPTPQGSILGERQESRCEALEGKSSVRRVHVG